MSTPNGRKFTMHTVVPTRASNNSLANEVSNIFYKYPFLVPVNTSTGSIETFYFNNATGTTLYLNSLTGPVLSQISGGTSLPSGTSYSDYIYWDSNSNTYNSGSTKVHIGSDAGKTNQGTNSIAIGTRAGQGIQGSESIAIGTQAGNTSQGQYAVAVGIQAGQNGQGDSAVAVGRDAGFNNQKEQAVALGYASGYTNQGTYSVAVGRFAGFENQGTNSVSIGNSAGYNSQGRQSIAIGTNAGKDNQSNNSIAIGYEAGKNNQINEGISIGNVAGQDGQGPQGIAIGTYAGRTNQGQYGIAIGFLSGEINQGEHSIAIGYQAGNMNQNSQSICINASTNSLIADQSGCFINPIRNINTNQNILTYNSTSKELTYDTTLYSTITNNYITSDYFYLYPPTSSYRVMSLQPSLIDDNVGGFKKNFYLVPFNGTISDIVIENVGESNPVKYDIRITKQSGATTTSTTDTIIMTNNLTNPPGINNFASVSYYNTLPTYESYLVHYYPFSYNFVNVADQTNYRSLIGTGSFTQESVKVGISSYKYNPFNSLVTAQLLSLNGTGSRNTNTTVNANGYTLIAFWFNVQHNFLANGNVSILFSTQGIGTGTQVQNNNFTIFLKNTANSFPSDEAGFTYQIDTNLPYDWNGSSATSENYNSGARQITHGTWNNIAVYVTPQRFIVWINGETWIYSNLRNFNWDNSFLTLGNYPFANQNDWNGLTGYMNDLRVYNSTTDYLSDWASYSTLGTTYPKINDYFNSSNITTSANSVGNSNFCSLVSPVSVLKGDRIYMELKENTDNTSNFDELVSAKFLLKSS